MVNRYAEDTVRHGVGDAELLSRGPRSSEPISALMRTVSAGSGRLQRGPAVVKGEISSRFEDTTAKGKHKIKV